MAPRKKPLDRVRAFALSHPEASDERPALIARPWFFEPPYVARHGWIGVRFTDVDDWDEIGELVEAAYRMTAPKRLLR